MPLSPSFLFSNLSPSCNKLRLLFLQPARFYSVTAVTKRRQAAAKTTNFDVLGTWDSRTELPLELESSINYGVPIPQILLSAVGTHSIQGRRPYNEDRFVVKELQHNLLYFAVFDGHGGSECADFCYSHMEDHLRYWIDHNGVQDLEHTIDSAFLECNNAFGRWWAFNGKCRVPSVVIIRFS